VATGFYFFGCKSYVTQEKWGTEGPFDSGEAKNRSANKTLLGIWK